RAWQGFQDTLGSPPEALIPAHPRPALSRQNAAILRAQSGSGANRLLLTIDFEFPFVFPRLRKIRRVTEHRNGASLLLDPAAQAFPFGGTIPRRELPIEFQAIDIELRREIDPLVH